MVRKVSAGIDFSVANAVLAGPGWGKGREELTARILASGKSTVLDADGIRSYASLYCDGAPSHGVLVMTPHLGELSVLSKAVLGLDVTHGSIREFMEGIQEIAGRTGSTLVVKSSVIHIATPSEVTVLDGCNPSLGVAGSGDVLSGGVPAGECALLGAAIHQKAGRMASTEMGYYDSEALLSFLGKAVKESER